LGPKLGPKPYVTDLIGTLLGPMKENTINLANLAEIVKNRGFGQKPQKKGFIWGLNLGPRRQK
jgi:hypothetical protein